MKDLRVTVIFDYSVPDSLDEDEFHDLLRRELEDGNTDLDDELGCRLDSVREITIELITD